MKGFHVWIKFVLEMIHHHAVFIATHQNPLPLASVLFCVWWSHSLSLPTYIHMHAHIHSRAHTYMRTNKSTQSRTHTYVHTCSMVWWAFGNSMTFVQSTTVCSRVWQTHTHIRSYCTIGVWQRYGFLCCRALKCVTECYRPTCIYIWRTIKGAWQPYDFGCLTTCKQLLRLDDKDKYPRLNFRTRWRLGIYSVWQCVAVCCTCLWLNHPKR